MIRSIKLLLPVLALLALSSIDASAQEKPAAGVELQLLDDQGKVVGTTTTKNDGSFSFKVSSDGVYATSFGGGVQGAILAINAQGSSPEKSKSSGQSLTATATLSDGRTDDRKKKDAEMDPESIEFKLELTSDNVSILSPRDAASGQSTGKRVHGSVKVLKRMDKSTPLLFKTTSGKGGTLKGTVTYDLKSNTK